MLHSTARLALDKAQAIQAMACTKNKYMTEPSELATMYNVNWVALYLKKGFSLVEMLIVVVILGIVISIAFPSYQACLLKSHRTDGLLALSKYQSIMERCYAQNFSYNAPCAASPVFPVNSDQNYYRITVSNLSETTFTLTASAINTQATDTLCSWISINQANQKTAKASQSVCWNL